MKSLCFGLFFPLQVLHKKSVITDLSISGNLTILKNYGISWLHNFYYINHLLLFLSGVPVVWVSLMSSWSYYLLCCKPNLEKTIFQSRAGQEIKDLSHWHRTLLLIVSQVTGSHMPAVMVAFGAARVQGVHLWQGTRSSLSWITKIGTRSTLTWKPAAGTIIS